MVHDKEKCRYPLAQIYFYLTDRCNLFCRHCWIIQDNIVGEHRRREISLDLVRSIIWQARSLGLTGVKLTGGEPCMHTDFIEILRFLKEEKISVNIETNGTLLTERMISLIKLCQNPFVSVSLDGTDAQTHEWMRGVSGCFDAAVEAIRRLTRSGIPTQIIMSLTRRNKHQIQEMVELSSNLGVESVKFNVMMPIAKAKKLHDKGYALSVKELVNIGLWVEHRLKESNRIRIVFDHPAAFRPLSSIFGSKENGCGTCGILGILGVLSNGAYSLCGIGVNVPELIFGHGETDRLSDTWASNPILMELRNGLAHRLEGVCRSCMMKNLCLGGCIAMNYYQHRSLWAPFWFCAQAKKAGIFPASRLFPDKKMNYTPID